MDPSANGSVAPAVGKMIKKERSEKRRSSHRRKKSKSNSLEKDAFQVQKEVHEQEKERLKDTERKKSEKKKSDGEIKGKADKKSLDKGRERSKEKCKKEESDAQGEDKQKSIDKENEKEIGPVEIKGDAFALEEEEAPPEPELTERQRISVARSSVSKRLNLAAQSLRSIPSPGSHTYSGSFPCCPAKHPVGYSVRCYNVATFGFLVEPFEVPFRNIVTSMLRVRERVMQ